MSPKDSFRCFTFEAVNHAADFILFGENVRRRREYLGLSQAQLAFESGIEIKTIQRVEKGTTNITYGNMLAIAAALGVMVAHLLQPFLG